MILVDLGNVWVFAQLLNIHFNRLDLTPICSVAQSLRHEWRLSYKACDRREAVAQDARLSTRLSRMSGDCRAVGARLGDESVCIYVYMYTPVYRVLVH